MNIYQRFSFPNKHKTEFFLSITRKSPVDVMVEKQLKEFMFAIVGFGRSIAYGQRVVGASLTFL